MLLGFRPARFRPARFVQHSKVCCSAENTHLKLLDRAVSGAWFLARDVFECGIAHRRSVAVDVHRRCCTRSGVTRYAPS